MPVNKRVYVIPNKEISDWWDDHENDKQRQEKLRNAIMIGLQVVDGKKGLVDPDKQEMYQAIEVLLRQGIIQQQGKDDPPVESKTEPKKKADPRLLRQRRQSTRDTVQ